jgi:hypothetical protein
MEFETPKAQAMHSYNCGKFITEAPLTSKWSAESAKVASGSPLDPPQPEQLTWEEIPWPETSPKMFTGVGISTHLNPVLQDSSLPWEADSVLGASEGTLLWDETAFCHPPSPQELEWDQSEWDLIYDGPLDTCLVET